MEIVRVDRLDHLGLIASVINDLGLVRRIDARLPPDAQEAITPGEAIKGMILNGLGFANRPLSLPPQFFDNKPLDLLFRPGVEAEMFNRFKLGRTLDEVNIYGCALFLSEIALAVCHHEAIDQRFSHLDTTRFSLSGAYVPESDTQAIAITHGYSKDPRPDLKQAVWDLMVSQDGGVPLASKSWDGKASDSQIFHDRAEALLATFQASPTPRSLIADSKLYSEDNAAPLKQLGFIPRMPAPLKLVSQVISQALRRATWQSVDDATRDQRLDLCHYGLAQRWLIVSSEAARQRAEKSVSKAQQRELASVEKQLFHLQAKRFETPESAQAALNTLAGAWCYHQVATTKLTEHKRYAGKGRPSAHRSVQATLWQIQANVCPDAEAIHRQQQHKGCFVLGTTIEASHLRDEEVIAAYKAQSHVEGGVRFLKAPLFFVSSLFVKQPSRMQGLLVVMTVALLVYSVAHRRLRQALKRQKASLPNQINPPTQRPTLRWVFQLLAGIHRVQVRVQGQIHDLIEGLNKVQIKILQLFGQDVCQIYQISSG
jgi:transposase